MSLKEPTAHGSQPVAASKCPAAHVQLCALGEAMCAVVLAWRIGACCVHNRHDVAPSCSENEPTAHAEQS